MKIFLLFRKIFKSLINRATTVFTLSFLYPYIYKKHSDKPIEEGKVIFLVTRLPYLTNNFHILYDKLYSETDYEIKCHFLRNGFVSKTDYIRRCCDFIKDLATAKYVFMDEATHIMGKITIRNETVVTQLWHGCGAFKKFGYSTADYKFGASRKTMERYPAYKNYTNVTVSSPEVISHFEEAMGYECKKGTVKAIGVSRTDAFFDEAFIKNAHNEFYKLFPSAKDKKVILYAPTFRGNVECAASPDKLDLSLLEEKLSEDYVLIIKNHPLASVTKDITEKHSDFIADMTDKMSIEQLLCISDICISDYSSLVFEFSLFERPIILFAYDLEDYFDNRGFYYPYEELAPGPVFKDTSEIIDYILDIANRFDKEKIVKYKNKFMSSCDGHATERIINTVFGESYSKFQKNTPLEYRDYHSFVHSSDK